MESCIANYYEDYKKEGRKIILECDKNKMILNTNENMLKRIFDNLIGNAYKHSTDDLSIKIEITDNVKIKFSNKLLYNELDIDKMFDEFYTVDIARTKGNTGLGLAIAKEFTEKLNGKIYADKQSNILTITIEFN